MLTFILVLISLLAAAKAAGITWALVAIILFLMLDKGFDKAFIYIVGVAAIATLVTGVAGSIVLVVYVVLAAYDL